MHHDATGQQHQADQAERCVLGSMLRLNRVIHDVAGIIEPDDYRSLAHRTIHQAILDRHGTRGDAVDLVILAEAMGRAGTLADCGGPAYLAGLWDGMPHAANATHYARLVADASTFRRLRSAAESVLALCERPVDDAERTLEASEGLIYAVARRRAGGAVPLSQAVREWEDAYDLMTRPGAAMPGVEPSIPSLAAYLPALLPGRLTVLAARPSGGKSAVALAMAHGAARAGHGVLFSSLEMTRQETVERLLAATARLDSRLIQSGKLRLDDLSVVLDAGRAASGLPLWIDDAPSQSARRIAGTARRLASRHGLGLVVVDYLALMEPADRKAPRHEQVGEDCRAMKEMAKSLNLPVLLLAQLNRESVNRADPKPRLSDLRDSGEIEQHADNVILLHRPAPSLDGLLMIVAKQRGGPTGEASCRFVRSQLRFEEIASPGSPFAPPAHWTDGRHA